MTELSGNEDFSKTEVERQLDNVSEFDSVGHPEHYNSHPSGIETIEITEHLNFCLGNAVKYILRCDLKGKPTEDLEKAVWYLKREIERRNDD